MHVHVHVVCVMNCDTHMMSTPSSLTDMHKFIHIHTPSPTCTCTFQVQTCTHAHALDLVHVHVFDAHQHTLTSHIYIHVHVHVHWGALDETIISAPQLASRTCNWFVCPRLPFIIRSISYSNTMIRSIDNFPLNTHTHPPDWTQRCPLAISLHL